ncbi:MAG TPA: RDD family protein [Vicinamibacterales bacterium]
MPAPENLIIDTPEQIPLEFVLAGVGSRFLALAFDTVLQAGTIALLVVMLFAVRRLVAFALPGPALGAWAIAALIAAGFVVYSGYFAIFESVWRGQTPGKRLVGLRVIDVSGRPVTVYAALIRNLIRIVDQMPGVYGIAIVSVLVTRRQQRLGDLAAGTVVVHERLETQAPSAPTVTSTSRHGAHRLGPEEIVLIESFLRRRDDLDAWVRLETARRIARRMARTLELGAVEDEERLLEQLAAEYRAAERYR